MLLGLGFSVGFSTSSIASFILFSSGCISLALLRRHSGFNTYEANINKLSLLGLIYWKTPSINVADILSAVCRRIGGKGTHVYVAVVTGDMVGGLLKDTAGFSLNIPIKRENILSMTSLPLLITYAIFQQFLKTKTCMNMLVKVMKG